jgi:hypothetical protein
MKTTTLDTLFRHTTARCRSLRLNDERTQDAMIHAWLRWKQEGEPEANLPMYAWCGVQRARAGRGVPGARSNGSQVAKDAMSSLPRAGEFRLDSHGHTSGRTRRPDSIVADRDAVAFLLSATESHAQRVVWELTLEGWTTAEIAERFGVTQRYVQRLMRQNAPAL